MPMFNVADNDFHKLTFLANIECLHNPVTCNSRAGNCLTQIASKVTTNLYTKAETELFTSALNLEILDSYTCITPPSHMASGTLTVTAYIYSESHYHIIFMLEIQPSRLI